jgi:hypothetical protein
MNHDSFGSRARHAGLRRPRIVAALAAAALLAAACSSSTHSPGTSPAQQTAKTMAVFAQCMRGHGQANFYYASPHSAENSSTPAFSVAQGYLVTGVNTQSTQFKAALASCKHLLPPVSPRKVTKQQLDRDVKFAQCMQTHGFPSYPDPDVQNGLLMQKPLPSSIDTSSPQFQAAETACGEG